MVGEDEVVSGGQASTLVFRESAEGFQTPLFELQASSFSPLLPCTAPSSIITLNLSQTGIESSPVSL